MKNEASSIEKTINKIANYVSCLIVYDTGSTDDTLDICEQACKKHNLPLYRKCGNFVDFAVSRNVLLKFADDKADYLLLLDAADEPLNCEEMYNFVKGERVFRNTQQWKTEHKEIKYTNFRFIKTKCNILYDYPVHEVLDIDHCQDFIGDMKGLVIYQDRTTDQGKSKIRWTRDKNILLKERMKRPRDNRIVFYLAQTYKCLGMNDMSAVTYRQRIDRGGYIDEVQQSYIDLYELASDREVMTRTQMYAMLQEFWDNHHRGEAAYFYAKELIDDKEYTKAYDWAVRACECDKPSTQLWVTHSIFDHGRWQVLAICGRYTKDNKKRGFDALKKALIQGLSNPTNKKLLEEYNKLGFHI
jgi:glycosyltransferase involved in cell wall biosynthesis